MVKDGDRKKDTEGMEEEETGGDDVRSRKNRLTEIFNEIGRLEINSPEEENKSIS